MLSFGRNSFTLSSLTCYQLSFLINITKTRCLFSFFFFWQFLAPSTAYLGEWFITTAHPIYEDAFCCNLYFILSYAQFSTFVKFLLLLWYLGILLGHLPVALRWPHKTRAISGSRGQLGDSASIPGWRECFTGPPSQPINLQIQERQTCNTSLGPI